MAIGDSWTTIKYLNYLGYKDIDNFYNNIVFLYNLLRSKDYDIGTLKALDLSLKQAVPIEKIQSILDIIEYDIDVLNNSIDWVNAYYISSYRWPSAATEKKEKVDRWIDFLNNIYLVLTGALPKSRYLYDIDNLQTLDINNNPVLVYE